MYFLVLVCELRLARVRLHTNNTMEQHPVVRYSTSELCNKGIVDSLELDKVVLERWDRFMQEGNFR